MIVSRFKELRSRLMVHRCVREALRSARAGSDVQTYERVRSALQAVLRPPSTELREWSSRIEFRRRALERSHEVIEIEDFGAGQASENRQTQAHEEPVRTRVSVSRLVQASKRPEWCRLLYHLCRSLRPASVLEMGTCVGISASYLGAALQDQPNARMITLEGDPSIAGLARATFDVSGVSGVECRVGPFEKTLDSAAADLQPLGLVFVDGNHREEATLRYFEKLLPRMAENGVMVFDDISWSAGMQRAWRIIASSPASKSVFDLDQVGVVSVQPRVAGST